MGRARKAEKGLLDIAEAVDNTPLLSHLLHPETPPNVAPTAGALREGEVRLARGDQDVRVADRGQHEDEVAGAEDQAIRMLQHEAVVHAAARTLARLLHEASQREKKNTWGLSKSVVPRASTKLYLRSPLRFLAPTACFNGF